MHAEATSDELALIGDSHVVSLGQAAESRNRVLRNGSSSYRVSVSKLFIFKYVLEKFFEIENDGVRLLSPAATGKLQDCLGSPTLRGSEPRILGISMPYTTSVILWNSTWKTCRPWWAWTKGYVAVSDAVIAAITHYHFRHVFDFLQALQALHTKFFVVESPPPRSDDHATRTLASTELLELDRVVRLAVRAKLDALGVDTVAVPEAAYDGSPGRSFLKDCYRRRLRNDRHHANEEFGALQLDAILTYLSRRYPASTIRTAAIQPHENGS
jgi:hypothetical protein